MKNEELMIIGTLVLLSWIGWELRRIANLIEGFVKGESIKANGDTATGSSKHSRAV